MLEAIVEFGAAVNGKGRSACDVNGCDEIYSGLFHQFGF